MRSDEEHDKGELKKVVDDEMAAHRCRGSDIIGIRREEVPDIANLQDKYDKPVERSN